MSKTYREIKPLNKRKELKFEYSDGTILLGDIIDEIEIEHKSIMGANKIYKNLAQKIKWRNKEEHIDIRFCYYVNNLNDPSHEFIFSKNPLSLPIEFLSQFVEMMKEKGWI